MKIENPGLVKTVYLSGPMRGKPDLNRETFKKVQGEMEKAGFKVVNPHDLDGRGAPKAGGTDEEFARKAIKRDLRYLLGNHPANIPSAEGIVLLEGWEKSRGATAEVGVARAIGIPLFFWQKSFLVPAPPDKKETWGTGAQRERKEGKGRYDLISPIALKRLALVLEKGIPEHGARNWEKGMPLSQYLSSAVRHIFQRLEGTKDEDDHAGQASWNLMAFIHTEERIKEGKLPSELDDLPRDKK